MTRHFDRSRTLDELDPPAWGKPTYDSYLVGTCHALRRKPVAEFSVEDLRIMIGQGVALPFLMPVALEVLEHDPLAQGDFYPGDLLENVLRVSPVFWAQYPNYRDRLESVLTSVQFPSVLNEAVAKFHEQDVARGA